jgi:hypothetical protein
MPASSEFENQSELTAIRRNELDFLKLQPHNSISSQWS